MVHPVNEMRKGGSVEAVVEIADIVTREEYEDLLVRIKRIEAALEVDDLDAAIDELDGLDSADPTTAERPALEQDPQDPAELTSEALEGSDNSEEHPIEDVSISGKRKPRAKRKPEGQDPLGLVPDVEED